MGSISIYNHAGSADVIVDAFGYFAESTAPTAPGAPTTLTATAGSGEVGLLWAAPSSDGGSVVTGFNVYEGTTSGGESTAPVNGPILITGISYTATGLTNGTTYYFTVAAVNSVGSSGPSNEAAATPASTPTGLLTTFSDGTWAVGTQIAPGTYWTTGGSDCYWARVSNLSGDLSAIIANGVTIGQVIVTILPTDVGFDTQSCGTWSPLPSTGPQATSFGDGIWAVGIDIAPGTYSSPGGSSCYWERDSDFTGDITSIIANGLSTGPVTVSIASTDKAFQTQGCGTWTLQY
jgi:hypothetical protein